VRVIDLALKDLSQIVRDRKQVLFLLIMPIVFTLMFGAMFGGTGGGEDVDSRLPVAVVDQDGGPFPTHLLSLMELSATIRPELGNVDELESLEALVADEKLGGIVIVPSGFSNALLAGEPAAPSLVANPATSVGATVESGVQTALLRLNQSLQAARLSVETREGQRAFADSSARDAYFDASLELALSAWEDPPITIQSTHTGQQDAGIGRSEENAYAQSSPGMMLQFAIAGLIGAAEILVAERKSRALQRLLTTAISRVEILLGHFLAMFTMIFGQLVVMILFGQIFLNLPYLEEPLATLSITVASALFAASVGLLVGALAKTEEQVAIFALIPMFIFAGLGGAWMPLEFTSPTFQAVGHLSPLAWAMDGYRDILVRGLGLAAVLPSAGALMLYTLGFAALAVWRFRFE
jgi:ABC-2 type transport system permease protein